MNTAADVSPILQDKVIGESRFLCRWARKARTAGPSQGQAHPHLFFLHRSGSLRGLVRHHGVRGCDHMHEARGGCACPAGRGLRRCPTKTGTSPLADPTLNGPPKAIVSRGPFRKQHFRGLPSRLHSKTTSSQCCMQDRKGATGWRDADDPTVFCIFTFVPRTQHSPSSLSSTR